MTGGVYITSFGPTRANPADGVKMWTWGFFVERWADKCSEAKRLADGTGILD